MKVWQSLVIGLGIVMAVTARAEGDGAQYVAITPEFVVNYGEGTKVRYLKAALSVRVKTGTAALEVNHHGDAIRHEVVMVLSRQTVQDINNPEGKVALRDDLLKAIQELMVSETGSKMVDEILFTDFIVQR